MRATGSLARITMDEWMTKFLETMDRLGIASSIFSFLDFTMEVADATNEWLPVLDMKLKVGKSHQNGPWFDCEETETEITPGTEKRSGEGAQIEYQFFAKPMASPIVILKRSALSENTKVATMV